MSRTDVPSEVWWRCTSCGDQGVISGWEGSPFDLRRPAKDDQGDTLRVVVSAEAAATLRSLLFLDRDCELLVFRATPAQQGAVLSGREDDFEELLGAVAAEANHEPDRRRRKRLDTAFDLLEAALSQANRP